MRGTFFRNRVYNVSISAMSYTKIAFNSTRQVGFALPTVLIASVVMLVVLLTTVQAITSTRNALVTQHFNRIARDAAEAGLAKAALCIESSGGQALWSNTSQLKPGTDCSGSETEGLAKYVIRADEYRATFSVDEVAAGADKVRSTGVVELIRTSDESIWRTYTQSLTQRTDIEVTYNMEQVSAGGRHSCGITNGRAYCWGRNNHGQLGDGSTDDSSVPVPVSTSGVLDGKTITAISSGHSHTCAIAQYEAYCWGWNEYGQLGNGNTGGASNVPVKVTNSSPVLVNGSPSSYDAFMEGQAVTDISSGRETTCAVANKKGFCWGRNDFGQLGSGFGPGANQGVGSGYQTALPVAPIPIPVYDDHLSEIWGKTIESISVSLMNNHVCAVSDGDAYCWGSRDQGKLGDRGASSGHSTIPVKVHRSGGALGDRKISHVQVGSHHSCAMANSEVFCWGGSEYGELGAGSGPGMSGPGVSINEPIPVPYEGGGPLAGNAIVDVSIGNRHTCVTANGRVYCWGGTAGSGPADSPEPIDVSEVVGVSLGDRAITSVSMGIDHLCAIANGRAYCIGNNDYGQLGDGTSSENLSLIPVVLSAVEQTNTVQKIVTQRGHTCIIKLSKFYCWGGVEIDGSGSMVNSGRPVQVDFGVSLEGRVVTDMAISSGHACILADGEVYCAGDNQYGQLGDGTYEERTVATLINRAVLGDRVISSIATGERHTCAVANGEAFCWGRNNHGQLGNGSGAASSNIPVKVSSLPGGVDTQNYKFSEIFAGGDHTCALANRLPYCWGSNSSGQLNNPASPTGDANSPVANRLSTSADDGGLGFIEVDYMSLGQQHTCALSRGIVICFGSNAYAQRGNEVIPGSGLATPLAQNPTLNDRMASRVTAGLQHTCAIVGGESYCWGQNLYGQTGDGVSATTNRSNPVRVSFPVGTKSDQITAGNGFTCATVNGEPWCWGYNNRGQIGVGGTDPITSNTPLVVDMTSVF